MYIVEASRDSLLVEIRQNAKAFDGPGVLR